MASNNELPDDWERRAFQSTRINWGRYSPSRREMQLTFTRGTYSFAASPELWNAINNAKSAGAFFDEHIKPNFPGKRIE